MVKDVCAEAINVVQCLMGKASHYNPFALCERIGISTITDKALQKDGYLVCSDGLKLIFVSSNIQNQHRREFVVAHEIGHFLMHQERLYCCSNVSVPLSEKVNSSCQEKEANSFATELLAPATELLPLLPNRSLCFQTFHLLQTILIFLCRMLLSNLFNAQKQQMRYCYAMKAAVSNGIQQMVHRNLKIRFQNAALLILASL